MPAKPIRTIIPADYASVIILIAFVLLIQACGISRTGTVNQTSRTETGRELQSGVASWYGPNFHGKLTANGETYNMNELTAAHRTLPFNTVVKVENKENGKSVSVRINDRGPYVDDRVIDLSRKAAREIDMLDSGTANVILYLLDEGDRPVTRLRVNNQETFTIQLASYKSENEAKTHSDRVQNSRIERVNLSGKIIYRVYYGSYKTSTEAKNVQNQLAQQGYEGFVKQIEN